MPEYLAPGVYVEEVDTGSKPIEGVSTSTAGMVGVTERGPVDFPILVTSFGEYARWFGERLRPEDYSNGVKDPHCHLPHAVEGFFTNGGKRLYVTRVLDVGGATKAATEAFDRGAVTSASTTLLRAASELTGTLASGPILVVVDTTNLAKDDVIRIGDGSGAEYRVVAANPTADKTLVGLSLPLSRSHDVGASVEEFTRTAAGSGPL
ncbi:phage tail sheath protein, partial [bacterium]